MTWKKYENHPLSHCDYFYQKKINDKFFAEILVYEDKERSAKYELELQIYGDYNIIGKTISIKSLNYNKLNFNKIKKDARKIIKALTK